MILLRLVLRMDGPIASPMASGMLFGQLCWALRDLEGEAALERRLAEPEGLWAVSDAFPEGCLPRPKLAPRAEDAVDLSEARPPAAKDGRPADPKALRRRTLITRTAFERLRRALRDSAFADADLADWPDRSHRAARNHVDRVTGRASDEGGLFFRDETWPLEGARRDIYVAAPAADAERVQTLFAHVGAEGYGKAAGLGRGRFSVAEAMEETELSRCEGADRWLSLSRGVASPAMEDLLTRVEPHFGKAAGRLAAGEGVSPFKRPILLTRPGATFRRAGPGRFGAWLTGVHPTRPEIGHNAFHVALPFVEAPR